MKKTLAVSLIAASLTIAGCATDPNNTQKGAAIGAVVGALLGKATGDNDKSRYAWGAAVGAIAGGAIGNYMDKQEEELRTELSDTGVQVVREGDNLRLIMPGDITFDTDRHDVSADFYPVLDSVAKVLYKYVDTDLEVAGFTDSVGSDAYNQTLSEKRASSVASYLRQREIQAGRLHVKGFGERYPIASNENASGRSKNRRVELTIIPQTPN